MTVTDQCKFNVKYVIGELIHAMLTYMSPDYIGGKSLDFSRLGFVIPMYSEISECSRVGLDVLLQLAIDCARFCLYRDVHSVPSNTDFSRFRRVDPRVGC